MSSPAGLQYSQADFLARWMPSSTRAGVILNPSPDLAGSLQHISSAGPLTLQPDDSFTSDFAPLPASADSSCLDVDGAPRSRSDSAVNLLSSAPNTYYDGGCDTLDGMATNAQDLPVMMKLEQLRKWQHHMQEQLKANQLEELLRLQEEQQRLLGVVNGPQRCKGEKSRMSGAEWGEEAPHGFSPGRESPHSPNSRVNEIPQGTTFGLQQFPLVFRQKQQSKVQDQEEADDKEESPWNSRDDQEQIVETNHLTEQDYMLTRYKDVTRTEDSRRKVENIHDRPIKPGIGGHMQTFEELLEEQLRLEDQRLQSAQQQKNLVGAEAVQAPPKRAFLKRGDGLARFTNTHSGSRKTDLKKDLKPQARIISRSYSEPASIQKVSANCVPRLPVQRKTAILNKENRQKGLSVAKPDFRAETKATRAKVLGSHQRQNTEAPEGFQMDSEGRQTKQHSSAQPRNLGSNAQPNPVTKHVGTLGVPGKDGNDSAKERSRELKAVERPDSERELRSPKDAFEVSFQEKLQRWECNRQLESVELGEFELLEQAAEELSFSSNSSFVTKILQMDKQRPHLWTTTGLQRRRLSSTPIKSPPRGAAQMCSNVGNSSASACGGSSVSSEAFVAQMKRKQSTDDGEEQNSEKDEKPEISDISSCDGSEFGDKEAAAQSAICFPAASNPPYDKRSYEDEDSSRDSASDTTQEEGTDSDDMLSNVDDSTLIEERRGQQVRVVFDDDDTWNDLEDTAIGSTSDSRVESPVSQQTSRRVSPSEKIVLRKVAGGKVKEPNEQADIVSVSLEPDPPPPPSPPPPASQLMTRLFPSLKPKTQNVPLPPPPAAVVPVAKKSAEESGQQVQSRQLRERLVELEIEIERFKKENATLAKVRQENEKTQESLRKERLEFQQMKTEEMAKFEEYKKEENKKLQKERKLFEKHAAAARAIPDKKEREEIQGLKQQLSSLQEELSRRESRWTSTHSRLRQQMDSLNKENSSLRDEIRMLEKLRLSAWKKTPVHSGETETTHDRRSSESSGPSVIKGVTFASPVASRRSSSSPPQSSVASRRASRDTQTATGIKSSLRKPAGSSSSLPSRRTEETSPPLTKSQQGNPPHQPTSSCSVKRHSPTEGTTSSETKDPDPAKEVLTHPDGKVEKVLAGGDRLIIFPNGTKKEISADGQSVKVTFFNGDTKQITADQRVIYYYSEAQTTHITYPDGIEVLHFPSNQTEKHFPDGRKEITFPDQTVKNLFPDGREESVLTDGTIIQVNPDGTKEIHFNTGQKEIHTADYKKRKYPDGTVKTVYTDGRQETRYPTGRVRIKDKEGNVVLDNMA